MKRSAGILLYRKLSEVEFFLVHPGGPFFAKKDDGVWTIPKGEVNAEEDPIAAAKREFLEETGSPVKGLFLPLGEVKQKAGKIVEAWAVEGDLAAEHIKSNTFEIEWPPRSGKKRSFAEIDKAGWFNLENALQKINPAQKELLTRLLSLIGGPTNSA